MEKKKRVLVEWDFGTRVRHIYSELQGRVSGILLRPGMVEYEVTPVTDAEASYRSPTWFLRETLERV